MRKILFLLILLVLPVNQNLAHTIADDYKGTVRVGVFSNPPIAFKTEEGEWHGISIDLLQAVADKNSWELLFVEGSFSDHLKHLQNHDIDLITMMAYSEERNKKYLFNENSIISNWGVIYSRADSNINSLLDLKGKKIAVMKNNIHDKSFRKLANEFGLTLKIVEYQNFSDVMEATRKTEVDAAIANRLFGALNARKYNLVETGIIFNPINIHYSTIDSGHISLLDNIDKQLVEYKKDKDSIYFRSLSRWLNQSESIHFPVWLNWLILSLFCLVVLVSVLVLFLRHQVASRTSELMVEVNERRLAQEKLDNLAYFDSLTKLPNRVSLPDVLRKAVDSAKNNKNKTAVLFIDIDRFKTVNDSLGHEAGDQLIVHVAQRLKSCLRGEDTINRFGGDEFVAILNDISETSDIDLVARRMLTDIDVPIDIGATKIFSSICIGISIYPDDDDNGKNLLRYADAAMYHAKAKGGNNYQFYNDEITQRVKKRLSLETRLRIALERDEFFLHYQPIFNLADKKLIGVEALLRWQDPDRGLVMPDSFIPFAEETGLILLIGDWVIEHACHQIQQWELQGFGKINLSINVSSRQFESKKLYSKILSTLQCYGIDAQQLELEITERMFLDLTHNVNETLTKLMNEGIMLSIDDFGTGYSSLSILKQLPIDVLKIDRSFIMGIPDDNDDVEIVSTILSMAKGLKLNVIAEGIENEEQLNFLKKNGCMRGQGYYLSKPLSKKEMSIFLEKIGSI